MSLDFHSIYVRCLLLLNKPLNKSIGYTHCVGLEYKTFSAKSKSVLWYCKSRDGLTYELKTCLYLPTDS